MRNYMTDIQKCAWLWAQYFRYVDLMNGTNKSILLKESELFNRTYMNCSQHDKETLSKQLDYFGMPSV